MREPHLLRGNMASEEKAIANGDEPTTMNGTAAEPSKTKKLSKRARKRAAARARKKQLEAEKAAIQAKLDARAKEEEEKAKAAEVAKKDSAAAAEAVMYTRADDLSALGESDPNYEVRASTMDDAGACCYFVFFGICCRWLV